MMLTQATAAEMQVSNRLTRASIRGGAAYYNTLKNRLSKALSNPIERGLHSRPIMSAGHLEDATNYMAAKGMNPDVWDVKSIYPLLQKKAWYT